MAQHSLIRWLVALIASLAVFAPHKPVLAETPVGSNVDNRVIVGVAAPTESIQGFLPDGWASIPFPGGPFQSTNVLFVFIDSLVQRDAEDTPLSPAKRRALALASLGQQVDGDNVRLFVLRIYTTTPESDPYGVNVAAEISRKTTVEGPANAGRARADAWTVEMADGGQIEFDLAYTTGIQTWSPGEALPHSARDPDFHRIYRFQQLTDLVASTPLGKAPSGTFDLSSSVPELASMLDGSEEIVAVIDIPVYARQVFLP